MMVTMRSSTAVHWNIFIFVHLEAICCVTYCQACYHCKDHISVVCHYQHHCQDVHTTVYENVEEVEDELPRRMSFSWLFYAVLALTLSHQENVFRAFLEYFFDDFVLDCG